MTDSHTVPHSSHWGAFDVTVRDGDIASVQPMHDPDPSPLLGNLPGSCAIRCASIGRWRGAAGSNADLVHRDDRGNDSFVAILVGRSARPRRRRTEARRRATRQSGDLRRLVRVGQCRHVPSEPEPAASFPEPDRRLHRASQQLQHRRIAGAAAASGRQLRCGVPSRDRVGRHRAAHRSDGGVRRVAVEEHVRLTRRQRASSSAPAPRCGAAARHADRALFAVARRRGAGGAGALVSARAAQRRRGDARPRAHARQRGTARRRVRRTLLSRRRSFHRVRARPERRRRRNPPSGRNATPELPRTICARWRARWRRSARSSPCRIRCSARSTANSRCGRRCRSPRCSDRSACPAAASVTATDRWATSAMPPRA